MNQRITAIYENGVLRPLAPLDIPERTRVEIEIAHAPRDHAVREALRRSGMSASPLQLANAPTEELPNDRRDELARLFASTRPLGDLISEDREKS